MHFSAQLKEAQEGLMQNVIKVFIILPYSVVEDWNLTPLLVFAEMEG